MRVHVLVADEDTARRAAAGGATVVQLRLKEAPTEEVVALGLALADLDVELVVNDDIDAALELGCGVHLGQGDAGIERAAEAGILLGISVTKRREAAVAEFAGRDLPRCGTDLGDAFEARCRSADRARGPARHLPLGFDPGRGDRRDRCVQRRRLHPRRRGGSGGHPRRRRDRGATSGGR